MGSREYRLVRVAFGLAAVLAVSAALAKPAGEAVPQTRPAGSRPRDYPTSAYQKHDVRGWTVMVHNRLLGENRRLGDRFLEVLSAKLTDLTIVMPPEIVKKLQAVNIWVDDGSRFEGGCYHWSARLMVSQGLNGDKARAIEIGSPEKFIRWSRWQPGIILHELAHGYNDHHLSAKLRAEIEAAYGDAMKKKLYDAVLHWDGGRRKAYAAKNHKEYFAEMTEAFFAANDVYPFVRAEIKEHDPTMYKLLQDAWCVQGEPPAARKEPAKEPRRADQGDSQPAEGKPPLPRVLLVGDSISMGYAEPTGKLLAGKADVSRIPVNGGPTTRGLENLDEWLGKTKWDVIHFNWGLHDMKHFRDGKLDVSGKPLVPIDQYDKNLRKLVNRLEAAGAKLVWASTTPVPEGADGRKPSDPPAYNAVAEKIMKERGIAINDLYSFALPRLSEMQHPRNVHFTEAGSRLLAEQVARSILKALGQ